jgi:hypothetical protein
VSVVLVANFALLLLGSVATAAPAAAVDDPTRPDARVTHGPSCRPGGLVVEVVAGTVPYSVRLLTTRTPTPEDEADLAPGETVVLRTDEVAWGETIDGRLEYVAADGSGVAYTDELEEYSFTRPTREDCEAVAAPTEPSPSAPPSPSPDPAPTSGGSAGGQAPTGTAAPTPSATPRPTGTEAPGPADAPGIASHEVAAGGTLTLAASGFLPGELVTIQMHGSDDVLGTVAAGPDGTVEAEIRIPDRTSSGAATLDLVGNESEVVTPVRLRVAGAGTPVRDNGIGDLVPLTAAAAALVAATAGLVSVAGRQRSARRRHTAFRHA